MSRSFFAALLCVLTTPWTAAQPASTAGGVLPRPAAALACERAAQDTLRDTRGAAATAIFAAAATALPSSADAGEVTWRGHGQTRNASGTRPFSYSCTFDTRANTVAGIVVRDTGTPERAPPTRTVEPDLSQISPSACESAAAAALKRRWPGVAGIQFNAESRQLTQFEGTSASLRGQGSATPSMRDPATHFSYDCSVDPRTGRVMAVRVAE